MVMVLQTIARHERVDEIAIQGVGDFLERVEADCFLGLGCL